MKGNDFAWASRPLTRYILPWTTPRYGTGHLEPTLWAPENTRKPGFPAQRVRPEGEFLTGILKTARPDKPERTKKNYKREDTGGDHN